MTAERVCFYFDPICPWCYQASRWARRLEELGIIQLDWGLFSLEVHNQGNEAPDLSVLHARSARALRTVLVVRDAIGASGVGNFYAALGHRVHELGERLSEPSTVAQALRDAGLDPGLSDAAWADDSTARRVEDEHRRLVEHTRTFGVPSLVFDGGNGPAIFGPVISAPPGDDEAIELWRHVSWLVRHEGFAELKRDRVNPPDLASVHRWSQVEQTEPVQTATG